MAKCNLSLCAVFNGAWCLWVRNCVRKKAKQKDLSERSSSIERAHFKKKRSVVPVTIGTEKKCQSWHFVVSDGAKTFFLKNKTKIVFTQGWWALPATWFIFYFVISKSRASDGVHVLYMLALVISQMSIWERTLLFIEIHLTLLLDCIQLLRMLAPLPPWHFLN